MSFAGTPFSATRRTYGGSSSGGNGRYGSGDPASMAFSTPGPAFAARGMPPATPIWRRSVHEDDAGAHEHDEDEILSGRYAHAAHSSHPHHPPPSRAAMGMDGGIAGPWEGALSAASDHIPHSSLMASRRPISARRSGPLTSTRPPASTLASSPSASASSPASSLRRVSSSLSSSLVSVSWPQRFSPTRLYVNLALVAVSQTATWWLLDDAYPAAAYVVGVVSLVLMLTCATEVYHAFQPPAAAPAPGSRITTPQESRSRDLGTRHVAMSKTGRTPATLGGTAPTTAAATAASRVPPSSGATGSSSMRSPLGGMGLMPPVPRMAAAYRAGPRILGGFDPVSTSPTALRAYLHAYERHETHPMADLETPNPSYPQTPSRSPNHRYGGSMGGSMSMGAMNSPMGMGMGGHTGGTTGDLYPTGMPTLVQPFLNRFASSAPSSPVIHAQKAKIQNGLVVKDPDTTLKELNIADYLPTWTENMRCWLVAHVLRPLGERMEAVDRQFTEQGWIHLTLRHAIHNDLTGFTSLPVPATAAVAAALAANAPPTLAHLQAQYGSHAVVQERLRLERFLNLPFDRLLDAAGSALAPAAMMPHGGPSDPALTHQALALRALMLDRIAQLTRGGFMAAYRWEGAVAPQTAVGKDGAASFSSLLSSSSSLSPSTPAARHPFGNDGAAAANAAGNSFPYAAGGARAADPVRATAASIAFHTDRFAPRLSDADLLMHLFACFLDETLVHSAIEKASGRRPFSDQYLLMPTSSPAAGSGADAAPHGAAAISGVGAGGMMAGMMVPSGQGHGAMGSPLHGGNRFGSGFGAGFGGGGETMAAHGGPMGSLGMSSAGLGGADRASSDALPLRSAAGIKRLLAIKRTVAVVSHAGRAVALPHFQFVADGTLWDLYHERQNVFVALALFVYYVKTLRLGFLESTNLNGRALALGAVVAEEPFTGRFLEMARAKHGRLHGAAARAGRPPTAAPATAAAAAGAHGSHPDDLGSPGGPPLSTTAGSDGPTDVFNPPMATPMPYRGVSASFTTPMAHAPFSSHGLRERAVRFQ
ncbi:hypothetical protein CXG81DRAFT_19736 [Caulochytrium protostelioides]|uniref:Uncharacterized protein n=1 Tax=Caulochytrium protostelioides TaxID=1555241 RepID=A0A4P9X5D4_9FUNG|nr:hypothetical protein CXG81DRAFT_19736 [Caulochytrium protostelioides]|eukprot:RKP00305.1 hypothetical protein CXG81DRAFT_19736 [Caulochytrium protostelioides]